MQGNSLVSQFAGIGGPSMLAAPKPARVAAAPVKAGEVVPRYHQDGTVMSALGTADGVGNGMFMADFALPMVGWLLSNTIGRLPYVGARFNNVVGAVTAAPLKALQSTTLGDVARAPASLISNYQGALASYVMDPGNRAAGGAKYQAWQHQAIGMQSSAQKAPTSMLTSTGAFGDGMVQQLAARGARSNLTQLHGDTNTMLQTLSGDKVSMWKRATQILGFKAAPKSVAQAAPQFKVLADAVTKLQSEVGKEAHLVDLSAAHTHYNAANAAFKALDAQDQCAAGEVATLLKEAPDKLRAAGTQLHTARSSESALQAMGTVAKNASLYDVALKGGLGLGTVYYAGKAVTGARDSIRMLQEAAKDVTGREPSTLEILFSANSLPPILREARGNMMARLVPESVGALISGGMNILFMKRHLGGKEQALMMGGFMTQMAAHNMTPAENFLDAYITTKDMQKAGQPVPPELYLELINASSVDARAVGGSTNRLVQAIAADYAKEQTPVAAMLKEIQDKEPYMKRAAAAADKLKAADAAKHVEPAHKGEIGATHASDKPTKMALSGAEHQGKIGHTAQHQVGSV